jgi:DNA-binding NarL/FixJ family response regulator
MPRQQQANGIRSSVLTAREHEISALAATGMPNKEIARRLRLSEGTVKLHLHHIFQKLRVKNRTALARLIHRRYSA